MNRRQILLLGAGAVTLLLIWYTARQDTEPEGVEARPKASRPAIRTTTAPALAHAATTEAALPDRSLAEADLFPVQSWRPPPPPPPPPLPPPPPVVPALPFSYVGTWQEGGVTTLFLTDMQNAYSVHKGDVVGPWRLDEIGAGQLTFTYLPMGKQQTMRFTQ